MRSAYSSLAFKGQRIKNAYWHINNIIWYFASHVHFSEREIFGLWMACAYKGCDNGFNVAAQDYFGKRLFDLSDYELAALIAAGRGDHYAPNTEQGKQFTQKIFEEAKKQADLTKL